MIGSETLRQQFVTMLAAALTHHIESVADLDALDRIDAHHRVGDLGIELVKQRLAEANRHIQRLDPQRSADRVTRLAQRIHRSLQGFDASRIGRGGKEGVGADLAPVLDRNRHIADGGHAAAQLGAVLLAQPLTSHRASRHHRSCQPGRRATSTARIAQPVLVPVGVVSMTGAEAACNVAVVLAALIGVADQQGNWRAGGTAFVDAGEDLDRIGLVALSHMPTGARAATVQFRLNVSFRQQQARRAAIDHTADRGAVAFAEVGDSKERAEGAAGHRKKLSGSKFRNGKDSSDDDAMLQAEA